MVTNPHVMVNNLTCDGHQPHVMVTNPMGWSLDMWDGPHPMGWSLDMWDGHQPHV